MRARSRIRSVCRWFFPSVLVISVGWGLVGDRRVAANDFQYPHDFASQFPDLHALLADQERFELLSGILDYNSLWGFSVHKEGGSIVPTFCFGGKEPNLRRGQTLAFSVTEDPTLPGGYRIEGPSHGFSYLRGGRPPIATDRECLKILGAAFGSDSVQRQFKDFLEFDDIDSISVEPMPESTEYRLAIRSPSDQGEEPRTMSWRVQKWSDSSYIFIQGND